MVSEGGSGYFFEALPEKICVVRECAGRRAEGIRGPETVKV